MNLNEKVASLMIRRFYLRPAGVRFKVPLYMSAILDQADIMYTPKNTFAILSSEVQPIMCLTIDDIYLIRKYLSQVNTLLTFYKPFINPSLSFVELSMLNRAGVILPNAKEL